MRDAGDELAHRGHLLALDELHLGGLEVAVGGLQLVVGAPELLGADAHLVLEAARQLLDGLKALRAVHRQRDVIRDRGQELEICLRRRARVRSTTRRARRTPPPSLAAGP